VSKGGKQKRRASASHKRIAKQPASREIPRKGSIVAVSTITSPKGRHYTILETDQADPYDDSKSRKGRIRG
jgi:hypothetical protein